ncbi:glucuronate isomerase [Alkalihalobacillus sp. 1P02AB]|uniref:glucuronate isomerase n=1 Tax=Alkalihalobacillus sp. 1P02AB TaxID=3132260 RepID=UPI0039A530A1
MFIHQDFMLQNEYAKKLYHSYAKDLPIYDFHSHLDPVAIAEDATFSSITQLWLEGDHYKWRAMRACGVDETFITGDASDKDKFFAWAKTVPQLLGNPLYHWTHMELKQTFKIDQLLNENTAEEIWEEANRKLQQREITVRSLLQEAKVDTLFTTDSITDTLAAHRKIAHNHEVETKVLPTFRADIALQVGTESFWFFLQQLAEVTKREITNLDTYLEALKDRIDFFDEHGCRASDHGIGTFHFLVTSAQEAHILFERLYEKEELTIMETQKLASFILEELGKAYANKGWVMQLHIGPIRNNNEQMYQQLGPDSGFDSMKDDLFAEPLNAFFNRLEESEELPKTICYNLDWTKNEMIAATLGNFQKGGIPSKMQLGSGWWYNDTKDGMRRQMKSLASIGVFRHFVGMLTDSRSFLSFARHDYFRRILCQMVGEWMADGEIPDDAELAGELIKAISFNNAQTFFE